MWWQAGGQPVGLRQTMSWLWDSSVTVTWGGQRHKGLQAQQGNLFYWEHLSDAHQVGVITRDAETAGAGSWSGNFAALLLHVDPAQKMVDKRGSVIVKMILAEIHQSSHKCSHSDIHTCPVVPPLESWDWTAPLTLPPRSVDRSQNSSAHWVGWHKQTLSPNPVSLVPQAELQ